VSIDDDMLMAFADGELDGVEAARVEQAVAADPALAARVEAHRALRERVAGHYAPVADGPVPDRFAALLAGGGKDNVVDLTQRRAALSMIAANDEEPAHSGRWPIWGNVAAIAATLVIGLAIGQSIPGMGGGDPVGVRDGAMVARGELASALDSRLASAQVSDTATRIGLTFRAKDGGLCRSFEGPAIAGVACRSGADWTLEQTVAARRQNSTYRQASSIDPRVMSGIVEMIDGEALDAAAEKAAMEKGWR